MIRKVLFFATLAATCLAGVNPVYPQTRPDAAVRQMKAGDVVKLGANLSVRVARAAETPFAGVKVKGQPVVVVLELDGGKKGVTLSYRVDSNPRRSEIFLESKATKYAPIAVVEDFPSLGVDNDKEVEILDPKDPGSSLLEFEGKGSVALLFDLPAVQAKSVMRLSAKLQLAHPKEEKHSFVVLL